MRQIGAQQNYSLLPCPYHCSPILCTYPSIAFCGSTLISAGVCYFFRCQALRLWTCVINARRCFFHRPYWYVVFKYWIFLPRHLGCFTMIIDIPCFRSVLALSVCMYSLWKTFLFSNLVLKLFMIVTDGCYPPSIGAFLFPFANFSVASGLARFLVSRYWI